MLKDRMYIFLILSIPVLVAEKIETTGEKKITIDKKHLIADFKHLFGMWTDIFSDKEMDFQYFATHDMDNNKKLDGLELFNALNHELAHESESLEMEHSQKDTENEVDAIFSEYDVDNDGFLDYKEFKRVQKVHEKFSNANNETEKEISQDSK